MRGKRFLALPLFNFFMVLLGLGLVVASHNGYWDLLHLVLCMSAAVVIVYVSRARAEYLWLGVLGGVALILAPLSPALTVTGPLWSDVIGVAVFVAYYKFCVAGSRTPARPATCDGGGYRQDSRY